MEIQARYVLVGGFTFALFAVAFAFILWISDRDVNQNVISYDIYFNSGVTGLRLTSDVLIHGIKVGAVQDIKLNPADLSQVRVRVGVAADVELRQDAVAYVQMRGLTGGAIVQITPGSIDIPVLKPEKEQDVAVIQSGASTLDELSKGVPEMLGQTQVLLARLTEILNEENVENIGKIIQHIETVTASLAGDEEKAALLTGMFVDFSTTLKNVNELTASVNVYIKRDLSGATGQVARTLASVDTLFNSEVKRLIVELRQMLQTYDRLGRKIENDPRRFLFGNTVKEFTHPN